MNKPKTDQEIAMKITAKLVYAMAYTRQTFKDKLEEHIGGAYTEFYKGTFAKKNGQVKWVTHWFTEVHNLLDRNLVVALLHSCRGFKDKRKALAEVVTYLKTLDEHYRKAAETQIKRDYKLKDVTVPLDDLDMAAFWQRVEDAARIVFNDG